MISRRDFLKVIGVVPLVLKIPHVSEKPASEPQPPMPEPDEGNHFYSGTSTWLPSDEKPDAIWGFPIEYKELGIEHRSPHILLTDYSEITWVELKG